MVHTSPFHTIFTPLNKGVKYIRRTKPSARISQPRQSQKVSRTRARQKAAAVISTITGIATTYSGKPGTLKDPNVILQNLYILCVYCDGLHFKNSRILFY